MHLLSRKREGLLESSNLILTYDLGTTGSKTCLYSLGDTLTQIDACMVRYPLYMTEDGGAEQQTEDWWEALRDSTKTLLGRNPIHAGDIRAVSFCCQMQGLILVDRDGRAVRSPMIYLDARAKKQIETTLYKGLFKISGMNAFKVLKTLYFTGGVAATPKDPLWKYHWVKENEPECFKKAYKWLDAKDYLVLRCTDRFTMTKDSANITFLFDTRKGKHRWHTGLCREYGVDMAHLPQVVNATDCVGGLTPKAARELGLAPGTPVFAGGGDVPLTTIGAGCVNLYDTHIYVGTSGWVAANVDKRLVDIDNFMASILGAMENRYSYVGEQETSGACLSWVKEHLALDEIGIYLERSGAQTPAQELDNLYDLLNGSVEQTDPGAGGLIFTPWLHGNRAPKEDAHVRGMFFNIGMDTGKRQMIRAVLEGVAFHKRWILEAMEKKIPYRETVRFVGGGAQSDVWCKIMADITGRVIETVDHPQDIGAAGAAVVCAVGLGLITDFAQAKAFIPAAKRYYPDKTLKPMYDKQFGVFKKLYKKNKPLFKTMNP
jgi:xylulokinase